jgi:uncharacterized repeat protein (TIGR01451 family)
MKKVLFPILALILALGLALPMATPTPVLAAVTPISKVIDRELAVNTQTTTSWKQAATITLTQDGSWLVLTSFEFGVDSTSTNGEIRLQQDDSTDLQNGIYRNSTTSATYKSWFWMTRVERSGSNVVLDLDFRPTGSVTARIRNAIIAAIRLNDLGTEDTDWRWNEDNTTSSDLGTTWTSTANIILTETWTPSTAGDWLIIANMELTANSTSNNADGRLSRNDEANTYDSTTEEGAQSSEWRWWSSLRLLTLPASSQKFEIQARSDGGSSADARRARFFAVRKAVFDQLVEFRSDNYTKPSSSGWHERLDAYFTPNQTEDVLILGHAGIAFIHASDVGETRVHEEETAELMHNYCRTADDSDRAPVAFGDILNWTNSSHNADLDVSRSSSTDDEFGDLAVIFVSLNKFTLVTHTLTVSKDGTGSGTVTSAPVGITCGGDCTEDYAHNTVVVLTAVADAGSIFTAWSGDGTGAAPGTRSVTMDAAKAVTATFVVPCWYSPTDDSWVEQDNPTATHGSEDTLHVKWRDADKERRTFLKFDLSCLPACTVIDSAVLHLYRNKDTGVPSAYKTTDSWIEGAITWTLMPALGDLVVGGTGTASPEDQWLTWDIKNYAQEQFNGDKTLSIILKFETGPVDNSAHHADFNSSEECSNQPYLEIAYTTAEPTMTIDKDVVSGPVVEPGGQVTYQIAVVNTDATDATGVHMWDDLPTGFTYASTEPIDYTGGASRSSSEDDFSNLSEPHWGKFTIPSGGSVTITFIVDVGSEVGPGNYDNWAYAVGDCFDEIEDDPTVANDGTPEGDPIGDEEVTIEGPPAPTPPPMGVGGEAYPVNRLAILAPWLAVAAAIVAGTSIILRRRRAQS